MPFSKLEKVLIGAAGTVGAGVLAWQTKFPWIKYDLQMIKAGMKLMKYKDQMFTTFLIDKFEENVTAHPEKVMVIFDDCMYTFEFVEQQANRVAYIARQLGLKIGDTVAMMIHNEPAFIWTLLGLQKLGITVALINYNLRMKPLAHSVQAVDPVAFIVGAGEDLLEAVSDALEDLRELPVYAQGLLPNQVPSGIRSFDALMTRALPVRPDRSVRKGLGPTSIMTYIYTSGTTGLPKPAYVSQMKGAVMGLLMLMVGLGPDDVIYTCLPLYHSSGGGLGLHCLFWTGCTMVLKRKFSATHFWPDCRKYNVTFTQYIGEIFRYMLALPPHELDSVHKVKAVVGNGLRKDIFEEVLKRYKIPQICEFFGATEGVSALMNIANKPGAVGRLSPFMRLLDPYPSALVKYDNATATPIRDKNGRCVKIKPGEAGLLISTVPDYALSGGNYSAYKASQETNEKKLVCNAFKDGDLYFNYGDVLYLDSDYFVYFSDRIGDTFRWKGENVSTTEVANVLSTLDFVVDANVYGVTIPGHDGRAGMAALTLLEGEKLTPERLKMIYQLCEEELPKYAWPMFLRDLKEVVLTGTYKQRKVELRDEGYDLNTVKDALYFLDWQACTYVSLTPDRLASFLHSKL